MRLAFSLVELAIVLVILGLLAGGVLSGLSLIRAAEIRSVTTSYNNYSAAVRSFEDKYFALPGDMTIATQFWGSAGGTGADSTCYMAQTQTSNATCNGNGDGRINNSAFAHAERYATWKHLANSGLIPGSFSGITAGAAGSGVGVAGLNVPPAKLSSGLFDIFYEVPNPSLYSPLTL